MSIALFSLASSLHTGLNEIESDTFIQDVECALNEKFEYFGEDFLTYYGHKQRVIYVRTGGTEDRFKELGLSGRINLLTSGKENSLAAAMEILSYVKSKGGNGRIMHGSAREVAEMLRSDVSRANPGKWLESLPKVNLGGMRLGVIGRPSDWLISSGVDYSKAESRLGVTLMDIEIDELVSRVKSQNCVLATFQGSEAVYKALCDIVHDFSLDGLTIRCFDLLDSIGNTGCLALARLNAQGIVSACEGDIPALITMAVASKRCGCPGFQCNLSRIDGDELLFAHCTVPLSMCSRYAYDTHFESGIGTAIKGELPLGEVTIFKISPDLESMVRIPARLVRNQSESGLCRTQVVLEAPGAAEYFLGCPLANHHVIVPGKLEIND